MQTMWTVAEAISLALKAELLEKPSRLVTQQRNNFQMRTEVTNFTADRGKTTQQASGGFSRIVNPCPKRAGTVNLSSFGDVGQNTNTGQNTRSSPYAKSTQDICYRCGKFDHRSIVFVP